MFTNAFVSSRYPVRSRRGVALVIILAFVVLLTGLVVAFFSRAMSDRQVSNSSASQIKADVFARGAAAQVIGDLKQEIASGSTVTTAGTDTIYLPTSPANAVPALVGSTGSGGLEDLVKRSANGQAFSPNGPAARASSVSSTAISLNNRSISSSRWNKPLFLPTNTALLTAANANDYTPLLPSGTFTAPDWVLVAQDGSNPTTWTPNLITSRANSGKAVVGRYAYNIYDEGGLLDMNAAGFPKTTNAAYSSSNSDYVRASYKGAIAFADLSQLPGFGVASPNGGASLTSSPRWQVINALVGWRNYCSLSLDPNQSLARQSPYQFAFTTALNSSYSDLVSGNTNGFLSPVPLPVARAQQSSLSPGSQTDQMFVSRQQLIRFFTQALTYKLNNTGSTTDNIKIRAAFPYMTHFSREVNSPTWSPSTPAGSTIDYAAQKDNAASTNRDLRNLRATGSFTRLDGTSAKVGDVLIKSRFPLSRLALLQDADLTTGARELTTESQAIVNFFINTRQQNGSAFPGATLNAKADWLIQQAFGLVWKTDHWDYCGPAGNTLQSSIATIGSIGNREPNFFELLKAGILLGSLGVDGGGSWNNVAVQRLVIPSAHEVDVDLQVLQIGANLIDQFDTDSYPTAIQIDRTAAGLAGQYEAVGIEHLPYIAQYKPVAGKSPNDPSKVATYFLLNLWNPHRASPAPPASFRPDIRVSIQGSLKVYIAKTNFNSGADADYSPSANNLDLILPVSTVALTSAARDGYLTPGIFNTGDAVGLAGVTDVMNWVPAPAALGSFAAFRISDYNPVFHWAPRTDSPYNRRSQVSLALAYSSDLVSIFQISLEYKTPSGVWKGYSYSHGINDSSTWRGSQESLVANGGPDTSNVPYAPKAFAPASLEDAGHQMVASDPRARHFTAVMFQDDTFYNPTKYYTGLFSGSLWPTSQPKGYGNATQTNIAFEPKKIWAKAASTFPALLSRNNSATPVYKDADNVQRIGDNGYSTGGATEGNPFSYDADRPVVLNRPFRSVAEMGYASRDMPFRSLDFFTDKSADAALLDLYSVNEVTPSMRAGVVNLNTRQAAVLQAVLSGTTKDAALATLTSTDATTVASALVTSTATNPLTNPAQLAERIAAITTVGDRKVERETIARALAGSGQTRTWNLMIDVIAQTGRYPQSASKLENFLVEGERRYWMHVAIDRLTGQVVDSQLESVQE